MILNFTSESHTFCLNHFRNNFPELVRILLTSSSIFIFFFVTSNIIAQPSGGPYGPFQQNYEIPQNANHVYYVAPDGNPESDGKSIEQPTTIESAFKKISSGDAIILRGGVYRSGNLIFNQKIIMQPYKNEYPILKGTFIASEWTNLGNGLWTTHWDKLFPSKPDDWWRRNREGKITPLNKFNNDMVFINGNFLQSVGWEGEVDENSYFIDYETGTVYIGTDPNKKLVEITAFNSALIRTTKNVDGKVSDKKGPIIKGIKFTQYAYRALEIEGTEPEGIADPANYGKDVVGTTIENCTISYCSRVAAYIRGDNLTIKNCLISDTSTEGLYIIASSNVLLEKNILRRNNIERITGYYPAAVKIFNQTHNVTCNDNLVTEQPYSNGIWYDVGNVDGVFTNNWIEGVGFINYKIDSVNVWPSQNGFFFEISKGATCAGNVFVNCDHGIMILNSSNVNIYNNTFVNSMAVIGRNERSAKGDHFGWHPSTGPDVDQRIGHKFVNNLLTSDENFNRPLLYLWQSNAVCNVVMDQQLSEIDYNVYVQKPNYESSPLMIWSPVKTYNCRKKIFSLQDLQSVNSNFSIHSKYYKDYNGPLFKGSELDNYHLVNEFAGVGLGKKINQKYLKRTDKNVGAYNIVE